MREKETIALFRFIRQCCGKWNGTWPIKRREPWIVCCIGQRRELISQCSLLTSLAFLWAFFSPFDLLCEIHFVGAHMWTRGRPNQYSSGIICFDFFFLISLFGHNLRTAANWLRLFFSPPVPLLPKSNWILVVSFLFHQFPSPWIWLCRSRARLSFDFFFVSVLHCVYSDENWVYVSEHRNICCFVSERDSLTIDFKFISDFLFRLGRNPNWSPSASAVQLRVVCELTALQLDKYQSSSESEGCSTNMGTAESNNGEIERHAETINEREFGLIQGWCCREMTADIPYMVCIQKRNWFALRHCSVFIFIKRGSERLHMLRTLVRALLRQLQAHIKKMRPSLLHPMHWCYLFDVNIRAVS